MVADTPYRVRWSQTAIAELKALVTKARQAGTYYALAQLVRDFDRRLRRDPLGTGEVYRSRNVVHEHLGVVRFLALDFAIDRQRKLILVRHCNALSGHGM